jgi:hypothetical protein
MSSSDEERDSRLVETQLQGMGAEFLAVFNRIRKRSNNAQTKDLKSVFLDPEGDQPSLLHMTLR